MPTRHAVVVRIGRDRHITASLDQGRIDLGKGVKLHERCRDGGLCRCKTTAASLYGGPGELAWKRVRVHGHRLAGNHRCASVDIGGHIDEGIRVRCRDAHGDGAHGNAIASGLRSGFCVDRIDGDGTTHIDLVALAQVSRDHGVDGSRNTRSVTVDESATRNTGRGHVDVVACRVDSQAARTVDHDIVVHIRAREIIDRDVGTRNRNVNRPSTIDLIVNRRVVIAGGGNRNVPLTVDDRAGSEIGLRRSSDRGVGKGTTQRQDSARSDGFRFRCADRRVRIDDEIAAEVQSRRAARLGICFDVLIDFDRNVGTGGTDESNAGEQGLPRGITCRDGVDRQRARRNRGPLAHERRCRS